MTVDKVASGLWRVHIYSSTCNLSKQHNTIKFISTFIHVSNYYTLSDDESDTGEKEERETKDKVEGCVQEGHADCRTERGR